MSKLYTEYAEVYHLMYQSLIDYDGVYELPSEVIAGIRELGYIVAQEFE
jgi:hypothetical protein